MFVCVLSFPVGLSTTGYAIVKSAFLRLRLRYHPSFYVTLHSASFNNLVIYFLLHLFYSLPYVWNNEVVCAQRNRISIFTVILSAAFVLGTGRWNLRIHLNQLRIFLKKIPIYKVMFLCCQFKHVFVGQSHLNLCHGLRMVICCYFQMIPFLALTRLKISLEHRDVGVVTVSYWGWLTHSITSYPITGGELSSV